MDNKYPRLGGVAVANTDKFEMIAAMYDTPDRIRIASVSSEAIRECVADAKDRDAIDFGCGTGLVGLNLADAFRSVLFLDTSPNMIGQVERKITALGLENANTLCFDFEREGVSELRADYIFMAQVLLHIPDVETVLARLFGVLNEGGHLIVVDFDKNDKVASPIVHSGFVQDELAGKLAKIGYREIQSRTFYRGSNLFMGQDASMFVLNARK